jgi:outer membrane protein, heavy metal efflux system
MSRRAVPAALMLVMTLSGVIRAACAQAPTAEVSVDELVARAVADNPELRAVREELAAAEGRLHQAGLRPNPMLELGGQKALSPDNNVSIGVTLPLDLNGRKEGRVGVAERELALRRLQLVDRERRLRADVRMKAGELFAAQRNLAVADDLLAANRRSHALVQERVRQGTNPSLDESLQLVEVNRLEATHGLLASRVEIAGLQLKALAGLAPDVPMRLHGDLVSVSARGDRTEAMRQALIARPDIQAARAEIAMATAVVRKEEADGRWDASVNVGYQRQDFGFALNGLTASGQTRPIQDVFHYLGAGVTVTLPIRNGNEGNIAAARAMMRAAARRVEFAELTAGQEVEAAFTQQDAAGRALDVYERGVRDVARRNFEIVRTSYALGRGSLLDVIAEQRRYIEIENGYTDVLKQLYDASVDVERVVGSTR